MKGPRNFYVLTVVYVVLGFYFLLYSDYPLFVLLFLLLAGYHFFLARAISKYKDADPLGAADHSTDHSTDDREI